MSKVTQRSLISIFIATLLLMNCIVDAKPVHHKTKPLGSIHEADEQDLKVLAHIEYLQRLIASQINCCKSASKCQELKGFFEELEAIAANYTQLAPGTAFLGPFSSVSLVLKQRELKARIQEIERSIE